MQLKSISGLIPMTIVTVAAPALLSPETTQNSAVANVVENHATQQYVQETDKSNTIDFTLKLHFQSLVKRWRRETMFLSSSYQIVQHPCFRSIVAMGEQAVPFILEEIKSSPSTLVWALNEIYDYRISNDPNMTLKSVCRRWVKLMSKK